MPPVNPRKPEPDNSRNEYIPSFISKKPFYVAEDPTSTSSDPTSSDYLEHQRLQRSSADNNKDPSAWYSRGAKVGPAATKFRKGACENCGAMTHKTKDCLSRPRKQGARWTGADIQADEVVQDVDLGWDAKRDRWNGYDAKEYESVVEEYNTLEEMKRKLKGEDEVAVGRKRIEDGDEDEDGEDGEDSEDAKKRDDARYDEETDMGRQQSTSTRQLRLREDTAKYLLNLDLDSAKYDPKTRSMVDAGANSDTAAALVAEEGFMKASGDAAEFEKAQKYAWETQERGDKNKVHLQANPTAGEHLRRKERQESEAKQQVHKKALLEKYGDQAHLRRDPARMPAVIESQRYVEYDEKGLIKGGQRTHAKSSYPEDVLLNNHTSVWGSWWRDFKWGYRCCHSTVKNSYCTGEDGIRALEETDRLKEVLDEPADVEDGDEHAADIVPKRVAWREEEQAQPHVPNGVEHDAKSVMDVKARKRTLEEMRNGINDTDMDEYRRKRVADDDPMKQFLGKDELVH